jgi:hypothetical protein
MYIDAAQYSMPAEALSIWPIRVGVMHGFAPVGARSAARRRFKPAATIPSLLQQAAQPISLLKQAWYGSAGIHPRVRWRLQNHASHPIRVHA